MQSSSVLRSFSSPRLSGEKMQRASTLLAGFVVLLGVGFSVAASRPDSDAPKLDAKFVIVDIPGGWPAVVQDGVTFRSVGGQNFVVIPTKLDGGKSFEFWAPADKIEGMMVFDDRDAAVAFQKKPASWQEK